MVVLLWYVGVVQKLRRLWFLAGPTMTGPASSLTERVIHPNAHMIRMPIEVHFQSFQECTKYRPFSY